MSHLFVGLSLALAAHHDRAFSDAAMSDDCGIGKHRGCWPERRAHGGWLGTPRREPGKQPLSGAYGTPRGGAAGARRDSVVHMVASLAVASLAVGYARVRKGRSRSLLARFCEVRIEIGGLCT